MLDKLTVTPNMVNPRGVETTERSMVRPKKYNKNAPTRAARTPINFLLGFFGRHLYSITSREIKIEYAISNNTSASEGTGAIKCNTTS